LQPTPINQRFLNAYGTEYNLYNDGEEGVIAPTGRKRRLWQGLVTEKGYPDWQERYAGILKEWDDWSQQVFDLYAAAKQGQLSSWFYVGYACEHGKMGSQGLCPGYEVI